MKKETGEIVVGGETFTATMVTLDADLQKKSVTITENTTTTIGPDEEYDGLEKVTVETDVQGGIDPSEANAAVDDVVEGKTFYAGNEIKKTGTLQVYQGATTITNNGTLMTQNKVLRSNIEIAVGGSSGTDVIFYDYDGSIVQSYSKSDFLVLSELPANPSHTGLVAQGWNWTLANAKSYVNDYGKLNTGQMYGTASGLTEFDIELTRVTGLTVTFNMAGEVDWGDGNIETISASTTHTYNDYGKYTITCDGTNIPGYVLRASNSQHICTAVRVGGRVTRIGNSAFTYCYSLTSITIPDSVTSIEPYAFQNCYSLTSITIPSSVTSIGDSAFQNCYSLTSITIPSSVTSIGNNAFQNCYSLTSITIPDSVTSIRTSVFSTCYSLTSITIPSSVTSIAIQAFYNCYALTVITIPNSVTSIGNNAFYQCNSIILYDFTSATAVPTLSNTNAFANINGICKIVVPDSLYSTWIAATNWVTYADYIYRESDI